MEKVGAWARHQWQSQRSPPGPSFEHAEKNIAIHPSLADLSIARFVPA
jgi:hypothetical protein